MANVINKGLVSAIFSNYGNLLVTKSDLAESMINISINGDSVQRLKGAMGSVLSVNFFTDFEATISLVKTSVVAKEFILQYQRTTILDGSLTLSLDNGEIMKVTNLTFEINGYDNSGNSANVDVTIKGDIRVNSSLL